MGDEVIWLKVHYKQQYNVGNKRVDVILSSVSKSGVWDMGSGLRELFLHYFLYFWGDKVSFCSIVNTI